MSDKNLARQTDVKVYFDGVDITDSLRPNLLSIAYTDNEEDEADDLQIVIADREDIWLQKWLPVSIDAAATAPASNQNVYKVTAPEGVYVRSGPGKDYSKTGTLAYGAEIGATSISNGWANIAYNGKTAYVHADCITAVGGAANNNSSNTSGAWAIGDMVIASGRPQYSSYGNGPPGANVTNYQGAITHLNLKNGIPYPIHVGNLGWFAISQVRKAGADKGKAKGISIRCSIIRQNWLGDGKDEELDCGQFELDSVEASGPPSTIVIKGTALPYSSSIRQTKKSRAWESYTLSGIAKEIAKRNNMACMYESKNNPRYKRVEQIKMSDIEFLSSLCKNAGISLKAASNMIVLFDQASYEAKAAVITITKGDGSYLKYKLSTGEADTKYTSCRVSYTDPKTRKSIAGIAYAEGYKADSKNNKQLEVTAKVSSVAEAKTLAQKQLRLHNKYEKTANFTLYGSPQIVAGVAVSLEGWGLWDGKYMVKQAKHNVDGSGGYTTQIRLRTTVGGI